MKSANPFLRHDNYIELQRPVRHEEDEIRDAEKIGKLSKPEAIKLVASVLAARTLTPEQKRIIEEGLFG